MLKALFTFYYRGRERKESIPLKTAKARRLLEKSIGRCFIQHRRGDYRFFFPREDEDGPALEPATRCIPSFSSLLSRTRTLRRMDAGCVHLLSLLARRNPASFSLFSSSLSSSLLFPSSLRENFFLRFVHGLSLFLSLVVDLKAAKSRGLNEDSGYSSETKQVFSASVVAVTQRHGDSLNRRILNFYREERSARFAIFLLLGKNEERET